MSLTENIGGFFVSLGLVTDRKSFNDGISGIKGLETSVKKVVGTAGAAAAALTGLGAAASHLETDAMKTAHAIGISYQNIDKWRTAATLAGVSAKGLTSEMLQLENKMQRMKLGDVDSELAKSLGMLRISYGQFADMTAEQRMTAVFGSASRMQDQRKAALLVGDALGSAAQEYYRYLQMTDRTLEDELAKADRLVFTDERTKRDAVEFMYELKGLTSAVKSIGSLLGAEVGRQLTPVVKNIKEIIARNKELIKTGIIGFVDAAGRAFSAAVGGMERVGPVVGSLIDKLGGLDRVIEGIGLGLISIKAIGVVGGIAKIISSMGLLKSAIAGLGLAGLYILVDDLMVYLHGGESVTGDVVKAVSRLREQLDIMPDLSSWERFKLTAEAILKAIGIPDTTREKFGLLVDSVERLAGAIFGDKSPGQFFKDLAEGLGNLAMDELTAGVNLVTHLVGFLKDIWNGDWAGAGAKAKLMFKDIQDGLRGVMNFIIGNDGMSWEALLSTDGLKSSLAGFLGWASGDETYKTAKNKKESILADLRLGTGLGLFKYSKEMLANSIPEETLARLKNWIESGGTLKTFSGYFEEGITEQDILDAYQTRGINHKNTYQDALAEMNAMRNEEVQPEEINEASVEALFKAAKDRDPELYNKVLKGEGPLSEASITDLLSYLASFGGGYQLGLTDLNQMDADKKALLKRAVNAGQYDRFSIYLNASEDNIKGLQDGIIKPGGGITRVAPDDWVFAVRNIADLAAAFMPSGGYSMGDQTITVNQTVNIQGGTNLAPATISQAAKQGVHGALQEMISRSVNRYQMMSGMR